MKKKVAFISEHASPLATLGGIDSGGQNVYVAELSKHLARIGYEIDVFTRWEDPEFPEVIYWMPGVRVIHIKAGPVDVVPKEELLQYMPEFSKNMYAFVLEHEMNYQLIHANFWTSSLVASQLKKLLQIPFVVTFHALGYIRKLHQGSQDHFPEERICIEEQIVHEADHIIAECPQDRNDLLNYYSAYPELITVIPCGFSIQDFYPVEQRKARQILQLKEDEIIFLQLGRMVPRKGVDNVIRALNKVNQCHQSVRLLIVGGDYASPNMDLCPEISRLKQIAEEEGVSLQVTFTGRKSRDMLKHYYSAADVFISTPWYEPFGITPLEAMACGTPVIGSQVGGIKYSVADGETGFLVPPNDPDALAEKMSQLICDPELLQQMKKNAIERVNTLFTWAKVAEEVSDLYNKVIYTTYEAAGRPQTVLTERAEQLLDADLIIGE
ncbi:glycosyltransferase family 1 protein [Cytophagaceae bacterium DM2B3-1]|uniref:Glycosyltransferase family 1 protein n=1 Tax=Xanthocytophaga flava TaxID=3048013 RepID=A0ABT7CQK6_9BACT|nr:glycosyltransferase family 1 protein [Xanthocytophaga flavus]MDJ1496017.1 glycosyltransferase family 1 protein [Xanthocytophaga flavus]